MVTGGDEEIFFCIGQTNLYIHLGIYIPTFRSTTAARDTAMTSQMTNDAQKTWWMMLAQDRKRLPPGATNWPHHCPTIKLWWCRCNLTVTLRLGMACTAALSQQVWACSVPMFWRCRTRRGSCCRRTSASRQAKPTKMQIEINIWYKRISIARNMQFSMRWDNTNGPGCILN